MLHPIAWELDRLISTPPTHHAHHAATMDDSIGHYKGNFGNMFFKSKVPGSELASEGPVVRTDDPVDSPDN